MIFSSVQSFFFSNVYLFRKEEDDDDSDDEDFLFQHLLKDRSHL